MVIGQTEFFDFYTNARFTTVEVEVIQNCVMSRLGTGIPPTVSIGQIRAGDTLVSLSDFTSFANRQGALTELSLPPIWNVQTKTTSRGKDTFSLISSYNKNSSRVFTKEKILEEKFINVNPMIFGFHRDVSNFLGGSPFVLLPQYQQKINLNKRETDFELKKNWALLCYLHRIFSQPDMTTMKQKLIKSFADNYGCSKSGKPVRQFDVFLNWSAAYSMETNLSMAYSKQECFMIAWEDYIAKCRLRIFRSNSSLTEDMLYESKFKEAYQAIPYQYLENPMALVSVDADTFGLAYLELDNRYVFKDKTGALLQLGEPNRIKDVRRHDAYSNYDYGSEYSDWWPDITAARVSKEIPALEIWEEIEKENEQKESVENNMTNSIEEIDNALLNEPFTDHSFEFKLTPTMIRNLTAIRAGARPVATNLEQQILQQWLDAELPGIEKFEPGDTFAIAGDENTAYKVIWATAKNIFCIENIISENNQEEIMEPQEDIVPIYKAILITKAIPENIVTKEIQETVSSAKK
jgi:hypothetical protein